MRNKVYCRGLQPAVARHAFGAIIATIVIIALMVACNKRPTQVSSFSETGVMDNNGNIIPESEYIVTNVIYITNYITNSSTQVITNVITNYVDNIKVPPAKATDIYTVHSPFVVSGHEYLTVSYKNQTGLNEIWLYQMQNRGSSGGKFNIRNRANHLDANNYKSSEDYYYIANNGDIYYKGADNNGTKDRLIKKFKGGVIIKNPSGNYTVGGLYALAIPMNGDNGYETLYSDSAQGRDGVKDFIMGRYRTKVMNAGWQLIKEIYRRYDQDYLEVLVLDKSIRASGEKEFGITSYYYYRRNNDGTHPSDFGTDTDLMFFTNYNIYLNERPEYSYTFFKESMDFSANRHIIGDNIWWYTFIKDY